MLIKDKEKEQWAKEYDSHYKRQYEQLKMEVKDLKTRLERLIKKQVK